MDLDAPMLRVDRLTVRFGGVTALEEVSFAVEAGSVCGLIGPNGAGKTTLFDCVSRLTRPQQGRIEVDGRDLLAMPAHRVADLGIARTFQHLGVYGSLTVRENVMLGGHHAARTGFAAAALRPPRVGRQERSLRRRADEVLERVGLTRLAARPAAGLPTARSSGSSWPARSAPRPGCCCWTSPPAACRTGRSTSSPR